MSSSKRPAYVRWAAKALASSTLNQQLMITPGRQADMARTRATAAVDHGEPYVAERRVTAASDHILLITMLSSQRAARPA